MLPVITDEWKKIYIKNNFQLTDPVIRVALKRSDPFSWDENISLLSDVKTSKIFSLSRNYNISNGFTWVLHDHDYKLCLLSIVNDKKQVNDMSPRQVNDTQMLLININEKMHNIACTESVKQSHEPKNENLLTPRESQVLYWSGMGKSYREIAEITGISLSTVKFHINKITTKLEVKNARQAIKLCAEFNLIRSEV